MAGTIIVSDEKGVAMNGIAFDYFSDRIRAEFSLLGQRVRSKVYWHQDVGCTTFITAAELNAAEFCVFASAVVAARDRDRSSGYVRCYEALWSELIGLIGEDARSKELDIALD